MDEGSKTETDADARDLRARLTQFPEETLTDAFDRHGERLRRVVRFRMNARLAQRVDVDDVMQEAWLAARARLEHFLTHETYSMFVWLRLIVAQTLTDLQRRHLGAQMRAADKEISLNAPAFPLSTSTSIAAHLLGSITSPSQAAMRDEMGRQLQQAVEAMEPIDREVLVLRHFEELTNSEIAEVLQIEQKAASIRYIRALRRLKEVLKSAPDFHSEAIDG